MFKIGDEVRYRTGNGKTYSVVGYHAETGTLLLYDGIGPCYADSEKYVELVPPFKVGDKVVSNRGDHYTIVCIKDGFAWCEHIHYFTTIRLSSLVRL